MVLNGSMAAGRISAKTRRPLSANLGVAVSYDMVVIGHGGGGQQKSHFARSQSQGDAKARRPNSKQQAAVARPATSRRVIRPSVQMPAPATSHRPLLGVHSGRTPATPRSQPRTAPSERTTIRPASRTVVRPVQAPMSASQTATAISAIMRSKVLRLQKPPETPSKRPQESVTPSPTETPVFMSLQASSTVDLNSTPSNVSNNSSSYTTIEMVPDTPSYKGIDALLAHLNSKTEQRKSDVQSEEPKWPLSQAVCGGVSSKNVRTKSAAKGSFAIHEETASPFAQTLNNKIRICLEEDPKQVETKAEQAVSNTQELQPSVPPVSAPATPSCNRASMPQETVRRSTSNRLNRVRYSPCAAALRVETGADTLDDTLINTEEVEHGYQLLLLECPNDIVRTFMQGMEQYHREKRLDKFLSAKGLNRHLPIFTIVQKDHFYTYNAILNYNFHTFWSWRTRLDSEFCDALLPGQSINHFSNITAITRKDTLWKNYQRLRVMIPSVGKVLPETFILPVDFPKLKAFAGNKGENQEDGQSDPIFIIKPLALSRGRQIYLVRDLLKIEYSVPSLAQAYITNTMLINRRKVDFRLYVGLFYNIKTRTYNAFLFRSGIARLCSREYNANDIQCLRAHLTNTSINGEHETAFLHTRMPSGHALNILSLVYKVDKRLLMSLIKKALVVGLLAGIYSPNGVDGLRAQHQSAQAFELLGADILLSYDSNTNTPHAHLLEFNASPSLAINCSLDEEIKPQVVSTMMSLAVANSYEELAEFADTLGELVEPLVLNKNKGAV